MNAADIITRGQDWLLGPDFLTEEHQASNIVIKEIDEHNPEIKENDVLPAVVFNKQPCWEYNRFSSYQRIIRVMCWIKQLLECKKRR